MSVRVMTEVWAIDLPDSQKIVLLALADCANDEGLCWPSMATLARKCSKGQRTIQGVIKELVGAGHLSRHEVAGKGCNYTVHPRSVCTPAVSAPPQPLRPTPAAIAPHPRSRCGQTIIEPSKNRKPSASKQSQPPAKPDGVSEQTWIDFLNHRKRKGSPLTETALKGIVREAGKAGWPLEATLEKCLIRGWQGFEADWLKGEKPPANGTAPASDPLMRSIMARKARQAEA